MPGPPEDPQPPPGSRFGNSGVTGRVQHPRLRSRWCHHQGESCSASCIGPRRCTAPGAQVACPMGSLVVSGIRVLGRAMLLHCGASALPGVLPVLREGRHLLPTRHKLPPLLWHTECDEYGGQQGEMSQGGILRPSSDSGGKETILTPTGCMAVTIHAAESTRASKHRGFGRASQDASTRVRGAFAYSLQDVSRQPCSLAGRGIHGTWCCVASTAHCSCCSH
ncbi:uncharacterized protein [Vulpes vulpes]|uniref:Uncharacterized protein n=1 Tax=Vulpes vulpes TaxID=9627 RepID=A0ABM5AX23_VULVU